MEYTLSTAATYQPLPVSADINVRDALRKAAEARMRETRELPGDSPSESFLQLDGYAGRVDELDQIRTRRLDERHGTLID